MAQTVKKRAEGSPAGAALYLTALLALPPLALGAVHPPVVLLLGLLALAGCAWSLPRLARRRAPLPLSSLVLAPALLAALAAAQLLPLPPDLLHALNPHAALARADLLAAGLDLPLSGPLSLSPAHTAWAAARWSVLALTALAASATVHAATSHAATSHAATSHAASHVAASHAASHAATSHATTSHAAAPMSRPLTLTRALAWALLASGLAQALIGLAQTLFGQPGVLLGFYQSSRASTGLLSGSFVNPNHGAAFLAMAALAGWGLMADRTPRPNASAPLRWLSPSSPTHRWLAAAAATLCAAAVVASASRSAIAALAASLLGLALSLLWQNAARSGLAASLTRLFAWAALAALPVGLALAFIAHAALSKRFAWEIASPDLLAETKLHVISTALHMIPRFPLLGLGADAFGVAAPPFLGQTPTARFAFVESDYVELPLTFGLPAALLFALLTLAPLRHALPLLKAASPSQLGLLWALAAFALSAAASFNLPILGLAAPALTLALTLLPSLSPRPPALPPSSPHDPPPNDPSAAPPRLPRLAALLSSGLPTPPRAAAALAALLATLALTTAALHARWSAPPLALAQHLKALAAADPLPDLLAALALAPTDGHAAAQGSLLLHMRRHPSPLGPQLATLAQALAPSDPTAHLAAARWHAQQHRLQDAALAYHRAFLGLTPAPPALLQEILLTLPSAPLRALATPPRPDALRDMLQALAPQPLQALDLATEYATLHDALPFAHAHAAHAALRASQPRLAELYAQQALLALPDDPSAYLAAAAALSAQDRAVEAVPLLSSGLALLPNNPDLRLKRAEVLLTLPPSTPVPQRDRMVQEDLDHLRLSSLQNNTTRAHFFYLSGLRWEHLGRPDRAQLDFERASQLRPDLESYQRKLHKKPL